MMNPSAPSYFSIAGGAGPSLVVVVFVFYFPTVGALVWALVFRSPGAPVLTIGSFVVVRIVALPGNVTHHHILR